MADFFWQLFVLGVPSLGHGFAVLAGLLLVGQAEPPPVKVNLNKKSPASADDPAM